jgi:hypothetical protein
MLHLPFKERPISARSPLRLRKRKEPVRCTGSSPNFEATCLAAAAPDAAIIASGVPAIPPRAPLARVAAAAVVSTAVDERHAIESEVMMPMPVAVPVAMEAMSTEVPVAVTAKMTVPMAAMESPVAMSPADLIDHAFRAELWHRRHRRGRSRREKRHGHQ